MSSLGFCKRGAGTPLPGRLAARERSPDAAGGTARTSLGRRGQARPGPSQPSVARWGGTGRPPVGGSQPLAARRPSGCRGWPAFGSARAVLCWRGSVRGLFCGGTAAPAVHDSLLVRAGCGGLGRAPRGRATAARCPACRLAGCLSAFSPRPSVSWELSGHGVSGRRLRAPCGRAPAARCPVPCLLGCIWALSPRPDAS